METANIVLIITGAVIMVANIVSYFLFMLRMKDVISSGVKKDSILMNIGFLLLIFFLIGYVFVGIFANPHLVTALILFFGSIFVSVTLFLMSELIKTAKERSLNIAQSLIEIIDARDPNLQGHSTHVKNLAKLFYQYLPSSYRHGINPVSLEYAALLHDIGKLGVPESILNKPDKLSDEEWEKMKKHPEVGVKLLKPIKSFDSISSWILYHHERNDGNGYYNVNKEEIPFAAKMLAIVDAYSAITMKRSYKAARSHEEAIRIIKEEKGKQFDPELADIFVSIPKEELLLCIPDNIK